MVLMLVFLEEILFKELKMGSKVNNRCLVCNTPVAFEYLNLGDQPLANSYHKEKYQYDMKTYPLRMKVCTSCWHSQLSESVDPAEMFEHYLYVSDTSKTLNEYFEWCKQYILTEVYDDIGNVKNCLEIACNSGLFLEKFRKEGIECVGVDPAKNLRELSVKRGLDVIVDYWNQDVCDTVVRERGKFDLILAFHVLPHVQDPVAFVKTCADALSDNGRIFIQTSQCDMFRNNEFDVIYHEHSSYFTARSIQKLAEVCGLKVSSIVKTEIHGMSYLFSLSKNKSSYAINDFIRQDTAMGIYERDNYRKFGEKADEIRQKLLIGLNDLKSDGYTLIGYGAAAKGMTLLNYMDFKLDMIIDDNPMKQSYKTPGQNITIYPIDVLKTFDPGSKICIIPLAWNFFNEIKERISKTIPMEGLVFVRYFPDYNEERIIEEKKQ